jgi:hypothetical protein
MTVPLGHESWKDLQGLHLFKPRIWFAAQLRGALCSGLSSAPGDQPAPESGSQSDEAGSQKQEAAGLRGDRSGEVHRAQRVRS